MRQHTIPNVLTCETQHGIEEPHLQLQVHSPPASHSTLEARHPTDTLWSTNRLLLKMAIEIVDFPMKNCDFPWFSMIYVSLPEGSDQFWSITVLYFCIFSGVSIWLCFFQISHRTESSTRFNPRFERQPPFFQQQTAERRFTSTSSMSGIPKIPFQ